MEPTCSFKLICVWRASNSTETCEVPLVFDMVTKPTEICLQNVFDNSWSINELQLPSLHNTKLFVFNFNTVTAF